MGRCSNAEPTARACFQSPTNHNPNHTLPQGWLWWKEDGRKARKSLFPRGRHGGPWQERWLRGAVVGSWAGGGEALMEGPGCFHATSVFRAVTQAPPVKASPASRPLLLPLFKVNFSQVHTLLPTPPAPEVWHSQLC